ncbi:hypothetical protein AQS8620_01804 [Aquimixticola soesokkakensis]|uniref:YhdP central domain-containing protein n=1 Tax=Aquimixticola soesokkakensis TaxID=1519096 RepID=A0A1Y5ST58_9RHOB|nr:DUF3971 domain-containing protein [Aquimixticola soesokkakensis]SLN44652.1 hypothetical protein AQS8620_01804 [Aquimixticola soesokkakensis]
MSLWCLGVCVVLALVAGLGALSILGKPIVAPAWLTHKIEARVNDKLRGSGSVSIGALVFEVDGGLRPDVTARNISIFDTRSVEIARINSANALVTLEGIRAGKITPTRLDLSGAEIVVRRRHDGSLSMNFGGQDRDVDPSEMLAGLEALFVSGPFSRLDEIRADALTIVVEDARAGRVWQVINGGVRLRHDGADIDLSLAFELFNGSESLAPVSLAFSKELGGAQAQVLVSFDGVLARDIAAQSPALSFLSVLDAPISGSLSGTVDAAARLEHLSAALEIGSGVLHPTQAVTPLAFNHAQMSLDYDPKAARIGLDRLDLDADILGVSAQGQILLRDLSNNWPETLIGQFDIARFDLGQTDIFAAPLSFDGGGVDLRLKLDPFTLDLGALRLTRGDTQITGTGFVQADERTNETGGGAGWRARADLAFDEATPADILALWPTGTKAKSRLWVAQNVHAGRIYNGAAGLRIVPDEPPALALNWSFEDAEVSVLKALPPITQAQGFATIADDAMTIVMEAGQMAAPLEGPIDMAGSVVRIPQLSRRPNLMEVTLDTRSSLSAGLSLMAAPPFNILSRTSLGADVAQGRAQGITRLQFPLKPGITFADVDYSVDIALKDVKSDQLVKGRALTAEALSVTANPEGIRIAGAATLDGVALEGAWAQAFNAEAGGVSRFAATVALDPRALETFNIKLPDGMLRGGGTGALEVDLQMGQAPAFRLTSDLRGLDLRIAPLGWRKPAGQIGSLSVAGRLGTAPVIDALSLSGNGLKATGGRLALTPSGALKTLSFSRVTLGDWLDVPVTISPRGAGVSIATRGGTVDLRGMPQGGSTGGAGGSGATGQTTLSLRLDRLRLNDTLAVTDFAAELAGQGVPVGTFTGLINGAALVTGALAATSRGAQITLRAQDGGGAARAAGVFTSAQGGDLTLVLTPLGPRGHYDGSFYLSDTRMVGAPVLAELLSLISVVGLLDQLSGAGILFSEVEGVFHATPETFSLRSLSATGPSMGLSLDGTYDMARKTVDLQGVVSPFYFLNGIGSVLTRKGEGLFGMTFTLSGAAKAPTVGVNPLSLFTPGMFRDIFRKEPPAPPSALQGN